MRAVLPGKPQAELQAVTVGLWDGRHIIAYNSGNALVILDGPNSILQTIYHSHGTDLLSVELDEATGKIATCSASTLYVYRPRNTSSKWSLQFEVALEGTHDGSSTLSWGSDEELLVGSSSLTLYATADKPEQIWTSSLSSPAKFAQFSHDSGYIASAGRYDRLLKVWRRLNFASSYQRFDFGYLTHPASVVGVHWRRPFHREQAMENLLYSICADNKIRIWVQSTPSGAQGFQLWGAIDLVESINPRSGILPQRSKKRFAVIIDSRDFTVATERAVQQAKNTEKEQQALAHLLEVACRNPEVIVALDDQGSMSAWGLDNIGCRTRKMSDIFNIAHVEGLSLNLASIFQREDNVRLYSFCGDKVDSAFTLLCHHFNGSLDWYEGRIDKLFDPSPDSHRLSLVTSWTGHSSAVKKINRTGSGRALVSRTFNNESVVWRQKLNRTGTILVRQSSITPSEEVLRTCLLSGGDFIIYLHRQSISLWDARASEAVEVGRCHYKVKGEPLCLILIPETVMNRGRAHVATVGSGMEGVAWEVHMPHSQEASSSTDLNGHSSHETARIEHFCTFDLGNGEDLAYVLPVDPAGLDPVISGFLDIFARDVMISYTNSGVLKTWTTRVDMSRRKLDWLLTSTVETNISNPSLASASSIRKAALVDADKTTLTIWDTNGSQLEHEERFDDTGVIQDLDWASTPDNQFILAVGFPHRVAIYAQLRYDYLDAGPAWASIRQVDITEYTAHPIGDSVWLSSGNLVIGAGNQLFVQDEHVQVSETISSGSHLAPRNDAVQNIFALVSWLNGPLPVFHAQFLTQCILAGKLPIVHQILVSLYQRLKLFSDGDDLDSNLGMSPDDFCEIQEVVSLARKEMSSSYADFSDEGEPETVTEDVAASLNERLTSVQVPHLSSYDQFRLADVVECVGTVEKHRRSIDENGSRFLVFFRQHGLRASRPGFDHSMISWREITWAYHSGTQDILVDLVSRHFQGKMLWRHARESGMFMWMTDITALRTQFEVIARNEYTKTEEKNPIDCSLYYLALKKKAVLVGLWRMATWSREQAATQRLLANNFNEPRWKTAALKNAYALMGKRRFEYAAAFFLLAGNLKDAVSVLSNQMGDHQLAITVARVYEGDDGPVLKDFLENKVLKQAAIEGNRWLATWAFWMLSKRDKAVRALVTPLNTLLTPPETPNLHSKLYLSDDPALIVLYKQLREKSLQTLRGAIMVPPRAEWDFVMHTARLYGRMGCDILALDLVRSWEFLPQPAPVLPPLPTRFLPHSPIRQRRPTSPLDAVNIDPRKLLRRRSSLVVADFPPPSSTQSDDLETAVEGVETEGQNDGKSLSDLDSRQRHDEGKKEDKQKPSAFNEPDPNSLLDAFGF